MPPARELLPVIEAPPEELEIVPCVLCDTDDVILMYRKAAPEREVFPVVQCRTCGLVYVSPRRRSAKLVELYGSSDYFRTGATAASGYTDYVADRALHELFFQKQIDRLEQHVPIGRVLDVGCAAGYFLSCARQRGWKVAGVEVSEYASEYARSMLNLPVLTGTLADAKFPDAYFSAVVMNDVIEHLGNPLRELAEVSRITQPGGVLLLHTPNIESAWHRLMGKHWVHVKPAEHIYYFSPGTLSALLRRAGFDVLRLGPSWKTTTLAYIAGRMKQYSRALGVAADALVRRLPGAHRPFGFCTGEMEVLARKSSG